MKRKKSGGGGANWMDTYGDMVTLLLCFFVLLYSMSTISEENWKALVMSFNPKALTQITATPGGEGPSADGDSSGVMPEEQIKEEQDKVDADIEDLYQALKAYAEQEATEGQISVTKEGGKVYVSFNQTAFFNGNSEVLREESKPILTAVSEMLMSVADSIDEVRIQGHTAQEDPNEPNYIPRDRGLASNRATNVLIFIQEHTERAVLDPGKLVSEGYGQWRPVGDNNTPEGRAMNRRVEMVVSGRDLMDELGDNITHYETGTD